LIFAAHSGTVNQTAKLEAENRPEYNTVIAEMSWTAQNFLRYHNCMSVAIKSTVALIIGSAVACAVVYGHE